MFSPLFWRLVVLVATEESETEDAVNELLSSLVTLLITLHGKRLRAQAFSAGILPPLAEGMRRSTPLFAAGAELIRSVLSTSSGAAAESGEGGSGSSDDLTVVATGIGFATLLDVIRSTENSDVREV